MWPNFEKKCQNVFFCCRNKEETKVQTFQQFLQNNKIIIIENELIACSKNNTTKTNKKKNSVPDKNLENDSVTKNSVNN